jgi:hypothetical protein
MRQGLATVRVTEAALRSAAEGVTMIMQTALPGMCPVPEMRCAERT